MNILDKIIANTRQEVEARKAQTAVSTLEQSSLFKREKHSISEFLVRPDKSGIIAEIKSDQVQ